MQYENDYFTATDYYYTQGIQLEYIHPALKKILLPRIKFSSFHGNRQYGIAINHFGFTPTNIRIKEAIENDQPYAGFIALKSFQIITDSLRGMRLVTGINLGAMGPIAGGNQMQTEIHRATMNALPLGWHNQIHNDLILNFEIQLEKQLLNSRAFSLGAIGKAEVGTLSNQLKSGINFKVGKLNLGKKHFQLYAFGQITGSLVAYDASLQGGIINRTSPYILSSNEIAHTTAQFNYGTVFSYKRIYLEYHQTRITKSFNNSRPHAWGGISIGVLGKF